MFLNIVIVLGSVRTGRMVERVGKLISRIVESKGMKPVILDPVETCKYELVKQPLHYLKSPSEAPAWMIPTQAILQKADGFVVLSAEYNSTIPAAIPNLLCSFPHKCYRHKPCGIVTYSIGPFGGVRALTVLRPHLIDLGMVIVPTFAPIPMVDKAIDENGNSSEPMVDKRMDQLIRDVQWYAEALKTFKTSKPPPS